MSVDRFVYSFDEPAGEGPDERLALLGGKGQNLAVMANELNLPVPPGFTVTTAGCRDFLAGHWPAGLDDELRLQMERLGNSVVRRFGDPANPLLVSVRSGAPVSMPGMMDTILNLGLNAATTEGLARAVGDPEFAADCLRRFHDGYRAVIGSAVVPDDPWLQLRAAIEAVFRSWESDRAQAYRRVEGIPDDLGTAVTVQAMVFGNRGEDSATGVLFTRNPATGAPELYGDVMFNTQGEDVVAGTHTTEPIFVLAERLPEVWSDLRRYADVLEKHYRDLCDIEFTIENGKLWMLQVRAGKRSPRAALRIARDMALDTDFPLSREEAVRRVLPLLTDPPRVFMRVADAQPPVTRGLPASPGTASGVIATSSEAAERLAEGGQAVILVRPETSPEDVRGMSRSAGVLTARGGLASHAAVVARGWGIPAVVGAESVTVNDGSIEIDGKRLPAGQTITIDGSTGDVFLGELEGAEQIAPEAGPLLDWARELGIGIPSSETTAAPDPAALHTQPTSAPTADDLARVLLVKGAVTDDQLAESMAAPVDQISTLADQLVDEDICERAAGKLRLTGAGKLRAAELLATERRATEIDEARGSALLEEFHELDTRMKRIVTDWQVRDVGGERVLNDHSDAVYDSQLLADLAALHSDASAWLNPLAEASRQFGVYGRRLASALEQARGGDQRFVASPRVDSYHSVWFELHEHLIRLTGRSRTEEAAAGRA